MDIVEYIETEVLELQWFFSYGNLANQNLIESQKDFDKIYFILDPIITDEPDVSEFGGDGDNVYTVRFMLLVQSDLDGVYFKQRDGFDKEGKYEKNILPLKAELKRFKDVLDCSDYERTGWRIVEAIDIKDANFDGLIVTTSLRINE